MTFIGLTGSMCVGKTTVARFFESWGAHVIEVDRLGHLILSSNKTVYKSLISYFGKSIVLSDGSINRVKLGKIVFANKMKRLALNSIVHPYLLADLNRRITLFRGYNRFRVIVIDAALLSEWRLFPMFDNVVLLKSNKEKQIQRLILSKSLSYTEASMRLSSQNIKFQFWNGEDFIIDNNGDLMSLERKAREVWERTVKLRGRN